MNQHDIVLVYVVSNISTDLMITISVVKFAWDEYVWVCMYDLVVQSFRSKVAECH